MTFDNDLWKVKAEYIVKENNDSIVCFPYKRKCLSFW